MFFDKDIDYEVWTYDSHQGDGWSIPPPIERTTVLTKVPIVYINIFISW